MMKHRKDRIWYNSVTWYNRWMGIEPAKHCILKPINGEEYDHQETSKHGIWYDMISPQKPTMYFLVRKNMVSWRWTHLYHPIWTHQICIRNISVTCPSAFTSGPVKNYSVKSLAIQAIQSWIHSGPEIPRGSHKPSYHSKGVSDNHPF